MSNMIKTIKYNKVLTEEFKWLYAAILLLTTTIATIVKKISVGQSVHAGGSHANLKSLFYSDDRLIG